MKVISKSEAVKIINTAKESGKFFNVKFIKRSTGEEREMNCRGGVEKHLRGGSLTFNPEEKNLVVVWDAQKKDYRTINLDSIIRVKFQDNIFEVKS